MAGRKFHTEAISPDWRTANGGVLRPAGSIRELRFGGVRSPAIHLRAPRGADVPLRPSHRGRGHARNPFRSRFRTPCAPLRHDLVTHRLATQSRWSEYSFARSLLLPRYGLSLSAIGCVCSERAPRGGRARKVHLCRERLAGEHAHVAGAPYNAARCDINHPDRFMDTRPDSGRLALCSQEHARVIGHRLRHR